MAPSQFVLQSIKKSFEGVHLGAKTYLISPASWWNSTTVTMQVQAMAHNICTIKVFMVSKLQAESILVIEGFNTSKGGTYTKYDNPLGLYL